MSFGISLGDLSSVEIAKDLGLSAVQIFTSDPYKFDSDFDKVRTYGNIGKIFENMNIVSHASLVTNLVSEKSKTKSFSINSVCMEMIRCGLLGIDIAVFHPGSCEEDGPKCLADSLSEVLRKSSERGWSIIDNICIENMVDSGNHIMVSPEDYAELFKHITDNRIKICLDTCHCWGTGYSPREFIEGLKRLGIEDRLKVIHFNNSQVDKGCHKERHAELFNGTIPLSEIYWMFDYIKSRSDLVIIEEQPKELDVNKVAEDLLLAVNGKRLTETKTEVKSMVSITGNTVVSINKDEVSKFISSMVDESKLSSLNIKLDGRANVKSVYCKYAGDTATIYTGAVAAEWERLFGGDGIANDSTDALIFIMFLILRKAIKKESLELKVSDSNISYIRMDEDFEKILSSGNAIKEKLKKDFPNYGVSVEVSKSSSKSSTVKEKHFEPLVEVPLADIPDDIDLLAE